MSRELKIDDLVARGQSMSNRLFEIGLLEVRTRDE